MPSYSKKSSAKLETCIKPIQDLFSRVVKRYDNTVIDGLRDKAAQDKARRNNASKVDYPNSRHNGLPPKFDESYAIDAAPYPVPKGWGDINGITKSETTLQWKERVKFYEFAAIVRYEWKCMQEEDKDLLDYQLTWGGDWDRDGYYGDNNFDDLVHFQITKIKKRKSALIENVSKD